MSMSKGLGRGLDALFGGGETSPGKTESILKVEVSLLQRNSKQPRKHFDKKSLEELADSIRAQGIIQPLLVRPIAGGRYQIVAGERRWRAAQLAGLYDVPVYVRNMDDQEVMAAALIENLQREDLNPLEEAQGLQALKDMLQLTQEELAFRLGKSRPAITNALRLLQLSPQAQSDLEQNRLSPGHARCLLGITDSLASEELRQAILAQELSVRDAEDALAFWRAQGRLPWQGEDNPPQPEAQPAPASGRQGRRGKDPALRAVEQGIAQSAACAAKVRGNLDCGKITLAYNSRDEFCHILRMFGLEPPAAQE